MLVVSLRVQTTGSPAAATTATWRRISIGKRLQDTLVVSLVLAVPRRPHHETERPGDTVVKLFGPLLLGRWIVRLHGLTNPGQRELRSTQAKGFDDLLLFRVALFLGEMLPKERADIAFLHIQVG